MAMLEGCVRGTGRGGVATFVFAVSAVGAFALSGFDVFGSCVGDDGCPGIGGSRVEGLRVAIARALR
jgi:hypothetical protein